jgi:hypothetical protein
MIKFNWSYLRDLDDSEDAHHHYAAALQAGAEVRGRLPVKARGVILSRSSM